MSRIVCVLALIPCALFTLKAGLDHDGLLFIGGSLLTSSVVIAFAMIEAAGELRGALRLLK